MTTDKDIEKVAQLWCKPEHSQKEMDVDFAKSIAELLAAERASIPESVKKALIGALEFYDNHCSAEDEECELKAMSTKQIQKSIAELDEWLKG